MQEPTTAYIGLGSNLGDRERHIKTALMMLTKTDGVHAVRASDIVETAPLGRVDQPTYLNAVAEVRTTLDAEALLKGLAEIETSLGRVRQQKWASRTIDLDMLLFGDEVINAAHLAVPHPQMHLRSFVLGGICQLNENLIHPVLKEPVRELAVRLNGTDFVPDSSVPQLVSIAGNIGVGKTTLAKKLSEVLGCEALFEAYDTNPFLADVYFGEKELALDSQMYFLAGRVEQLNPVTLPAGKIVVSDYVFEKEQIYAAALLNDRQLALYQKIYGLLRSRVTVPVLVIYLQDLAENCLGRIHRRNRPYEQVIQQEFLNSLGHGYEQLFREWKRCPVIRVSMSQFDCRRQSDMNHLTKQIESYIAK